MQGVMNGLGQASGGLSQRTVLITGVSKGLGRALALELAKRGHSVIGCSRSQDKLSSLNSQLLSYDTSSPDKHFILPADVVSISASFLHSNLCFCPQVCFRGMWSPNVACRGLIPALKSLHVLLLKGRAFLISLVFSFLFLLSPIVRHWTAVFQF